jgi:Flp pilus assembly protein TadG
MIKGTRQGRRRGGAALVETAFVMIIFVGLAFAIFEYCRLIYMQQLVENAAREGGRYAAVNSTDPSIVTNTKNIVLQRTAGWVTSANVKVFQSNASGTNIGPATNLQFGQYIGVQVSTTYTSMLPRLLFMPNTVAISFTCVMYTEGN